MARNVEKAQNMLNRYLASKDGGIESQKKKRPYLASQCDDLSEADGWRHQILREIGRKVMDIQNEGLGEHRLRDLNDEINKLMREKSHWERRIVELGGPNYARFGPKVTDSKGRVVGEALSKGAGYRYYGAAKNLPGVKELFEKLDSAQPIAKATKGELQRRVDGDYYGFRDEDDGVLVRVEAEAEKAMREDAVRAWEEENSMRTDVLDTVREEEAAVDTRFDFHVPLPEDKEIEAKVIQSKKEALLSKYASESLQEEQDKAKDLLRAGGKDDVH